MKIGIFNESAHNNAVPKSWLGTFFRLVKVANGTTVDDVLAKIEGATGLSSMKAVMPNGCVVPAQDLLEGDTYIRRREQTGPMEYAPPLPGIAMVEDKKNYLVLGILGDINGKSPEELEALVAAERTAFENVKPQEPVKNYKCKEG